MRQSWFDEVMCGLSRLIRFNPDFSRNFRATRRQFLWSFIVLIPGFAITVASWFTGRDIATNVSAASLVLIVLAAFLGTWLLMPCLIFCIGRIWNRRQEGYDATFFYNVWTLLFSCVVVVLWFLGTTSFMPLDSQWIVWTVAWAAIVFFFVYEVYALRTLLRIDGFWAFALSAFSLTASTVVSQLMTTCLLAVPAS